MVLLRYMQSLMLRYPVTCSVRGFFLRPTQNAFGKLKPTPVSILVQDSFIQAL